MSNPFPFSDDNKRYLTQNYFLRKKFGEKVFKISLNGNFTCPNIDGTKGVGGCTYCSSLGSGDFGGNPSEDICTQFQDVKEKMQHKWHGEYIAYFQANTNTYAHVSKLRELFETALRQEGVVGLSIATRADCLNDDVVEYLSELSTRTYLTVELGLQTVHDSTGTHINRCHTYSDFLSGYEKLHCRGINVCVHVINGLPHETHNMMLETVKEISRLDIHSIKLHLLHVIKGTKIADEYIRGEFKLLSLEEYVQIICDQIELLSPNVIIQRITGDGDKKTLIGPLWSLNKLVVMNEIDKEFARRNSYQGLKYSPTTLNTQAHL